MRASLGGQRASGLQPAAASNVSVLAASSSSSSSRWPIRQQPRWPCQLLQQRGLQLQPGAADRSRTAGGGGSNSSSSSSPAAMHRSGSASVSVLQPLQRQQHMQHPPETRAHAHNQQGHREPRRQLDDGSSRIIMLLALSLTLLLLPWVAHHPEFLVAPLVLACTPVVGNGVRPVLREAAAGLMTTLKLMGLAAWYDVTHEAAPQQLHHPHAHAPAAVSGGKRPHNLQQQQQQYRTQDFQHPQQQQQQQPAPMGPSSPWPNPARMPSNWSPPASYDAAAAGASSSSSSTGGPSSHPLPAASEDADADWSPSGPPDPHQRDPGSMQHLQAVLAADLQLGSGGLPQQAAPAAGAAGAAAPSRRRSPAGSPCGSPAGSLDLGDAPLPMQQQQQAPQPHHPAGRDPRTLSREAKQQLYHQQQQQQAHGGALGSGDQL